MLENGLGVLLEREVPRSRRFVDLFAGSGAVSIRVAQRFPIEVQAFDLQYYSAVLTDSVVRRAEKIQWQAIWRAWLQRAQQIVPIKCPVPQKITKSSVADLRAWSSEQFSLPITKAYGGHYFSPQQAVWFDALRATLPRRESARTVALASLIQVASACAAAPGHTAQPFQPTRTAKRYLLEAWNRDVIGRTKAVFQVLASQFALMVGSAAVEDANEAAKNLQEGDLAFIDPPYSGVHYSRFYHVLETIAHGQCTEVSGTGRYPAPEFRPRSRYSVTSESNSALDELLKSVSSNGARAIVTFPDYDCSNGLSGECLQEIARKYFRIRGRTVKSRFSSLGGTGDLRGNEAGRAPRKHANELMLVLEPK
jgi:adenine-specific DNA methylase